MAECNPGIVLVGTGRGLREVAWDGREVRPVPGPENAIRELLVLPGAETFAASWWTLHERESTDCAPDVRRTRFFRVDLGFSPGRRAEKSLAVGDHRAGVDMVR